jgi:hypothetical protein
MVVATATGLVLFAVDRAFKVFVSGIIIKVFNLKTI